MSIFVLFLLASIGCTPTTKPIKIKNIIFDLGGVLFNIDYQATIDSFSENVSPYFAKEFCQNKQSPLFDDIECGRVDTTRALKNGFNCPANISDKAVNEAWNMMILNLPRERVHLVEELKKEYKVFSFSNTNKVHIDRALEIVERDLGAENGLDEWNRLFDKHYYSYEIGLRKPDLNSFEFVINDANIIKEETLFVDDTIRHVRGGKLAGLHVWMITKEWPMMRIREIIGQIESGKTFE